MTIPRTGLLFLLLGVIASGCAIGPTLTPITDPTQRLQFQGFSILPPKGENWFIAELPYPTDPNWAVPVTFGKKLREKAQRPGEYHPIYVHVQTGSLGDVRFESRSELLQQLARQIEMELTTPTPRRRAPQVRVFLDKWLGFDCIRFESRAEDPMVPELPGFVFTFTRQGFIFLHPDAATFIVWLEYGQKYLKGQQPFALEAEVEPFLKSLEFAPLR
jgi:hypothetical protein